MENNKKLLNIIFRLIIFVCFVMAVVMVVNIVKFALIMDEDDRAKIDEFSSSIKTFATLFNCIFFATLAEIVLSILAKYKCKTVSQVTRTFFLIVTAAAMGLAFKVTSAFIEVCDVLDKLGTTNLNRISDDSLKDAGMTADRADEIAKLMGECRSNNAKSSSR